ncbi:MAG TPA: hypothetical protein VHF47_09005 [Acidimicrobiales bacterium]|nr:hypothetical protein [Acidimicrobiales bacterium]
MASSFRLLIDGAPAADDLLGAMRALEVEENADLPDAFRLDLAVTAREGELDFPSDERLKPFANVAVVAALEDGPPACIFDGYVLSHRLHLETGVVASTLEVWGQDASWLMNLEEKVREWVDVTDAQVAAAVFGDYGISPSSRNSDEDSPSHVEDGHTLMQRSSDIQFLRDLARRNGKLCRVACEDEPGRRVGWFAAPRLDAEPVATIKLNDPEAPTLDALDIDWDVARPTAAIASQALFTDDDPDGVAGDADDGGFDPLDQRDLVTFAGKPMTVLLTTTVDDAGELSLRTTSLLREAGWFVRCEGEADVNRLGVVPRVGDVVALEGLGSLHSGRYLVWSARHRITADAHRVRLVLRRNAVGPAPTGGGLLGGLL